MKFKFVKIRLHVKLNYTLRILQRKKYFPQKKKSISQRKKNLLFNTAEENQNKKNHERVI